MECLEVFLSKKTDTTMRQAAMKVAMAAAVPKAISPYEMAEKPAAIAAKGSCECTCAVGLQPDAVALTIVVSEKGLQ